MTVHGPVHEQRVAGIERGEHVRPVRGRGRERVDEEARERAVPAQQPMSLARALARTAHRELPLPLLLPLPLRFLLSLLLTSLPFFSFILIPPKDLALRRLKTTISIQENSGDRGAGLTVIPSQERLANSSG